MNLFDIKELFKLVRKFDLSVFHEVQDEIDCKPSYHDISNFSLESIKMSGSDVFAVFKYEEMWCDGGIYRIKLPLNIFLNKNSLARYLESLYNIHKEKQEIKKKRQEDEKRRFEQNELSELRRLQAKYGISN